MLEHEDGTGFFWMADTAWFMHMRMNREETDTYLTDRADKGFTVVLTNIMSLVWQQNSYGDSPFPVQWAEADANGVADNREAFKINELTTTPGNDPEDAEEYDYWDHVDYAIDKAAEKGLYIALVTSWAGHVEMFIKEDETIYREYATWLAERYKDKPNIIWLNGGDVYKSELVGIDQWDWMGEAIKAKDSNHLLSFHGVSSAQTHNDKSWLDFNIVESGHGIDTIGQNEQLTDDYNAFTSKPIVDAETRYEEMSTSTFHRITPFEVREIAYFQLFSGAFGHTYGHNSIWQVSYQSDVDKGKPEAEGYGQRIYPLQTWEEALNTPAASQMNYLSKLMQSRPLLGRVPDQSLIVSGDSIATRATLGDGYAFVYSTSKEELSIALGKVSGTTVNIWSYNPETGEVKSLKSALANSGTYTFVPEDSDDDWLVVIDDASKGYGTPGESL